MALPCQPGGSVPPCLCGSHRTWQRHVPTPLNPKLSTLNRVGRWLFEVEFEGRVGGDGDVEAFGGCRYGGAFVYEYSLGSVEGYFSS